ncbi:MAG: PPOX class F420-dependent oxidoreductase [Actinomycetota bacterium]|nr:PPOX class F420-dependent oxidoreductase [Actinomycetota bacterium]
MADPLDRLAAQKFVALTTFKRSGEGVATPMWVAVDDDRLAFWTPSDSWKVTRARRDPRVTVVPCSRLGSVPAGEHPVSGHAEVVDDATDVRRVRAAMKQKYGLVFTLVTIVERVMRRGPEDRTALLVTLD